MKEKVAIYSEKNETIALHHIDHLPSFYPKRCMIETTFYLTYPLSNLRDSLQVAKKHKKAKQSLFIDLLGAGEVLAHNRRQIIAAFSA